MRLSLQFGLALALALGACSWPAQCVAEQPASDAATAALRHFESRVRPLLAAHCIKCHGAKKQQGGLRLDTRAAMLEGGDSGPAATPGNADESLLIQAVRYESLEMPPTGRLDASQIKALESWIGAGAVWPELEQPVREATAAVSSSDRQWWAFRPLADAAPPDANGDPWTRNPLDQFVLHRLRAEGLSPAPRADPRTLVRRLYFDVLGVPPTPEEMEAFAADPSEAAWESLVDRLLADTRYGEHWARHWLDLVRYAESDGWNQDAHRPQIWRYRDYVVDAFNRDKPYPLFVREQLAGDEMPDAGPWQLAATGYLRLGIYEYNQRDARSHWNDIMNEMTDVTADVFFGLPMACARCHDHKFDPLPQQDYFKLRAFFEPIVWRDDLYFATDERKAEHAEAERKWERATADVRQRIDALLKPYYDRKWRSTVEKFPLDIQACYHKPVDERTSWDQQMAYLVERQFYEEGGGPLKALSKPDKEKYEALQKELAEFDSLKPPPLPPLMAATDFAGSPSTTTIPDDGEHREILPGFLSVLTPEDASPLEITRQDASTGRRSALADWIGSDDNPLTTRVIVNRVWQQHFGQGLVPTANDFGHLGQPPTHPELLDWLTARFLEDGWRLKPLHKRILLSATWRQSATHPDAARQQEQDPAENLLWRARIRRLSAEQIRDAMLSVSGELDVQQGGPSVDARSPRRALYLKSMRNTPNSLLHAFDVANGLKSVAERNSTTTPTQSLLIFNGAYTLERARKWAARLRRSGDRPAAALLADAVQAGWGRQPTDSEREESLRYLQASADTPAKDVSLERLVDWCHVLLNASEFLYVD